jgi:hypothetical protein
VWPLNNRSIQRHIRNVAHSSSVYPDGFPSVHRPPKDSRSVVAPQDSTFAHTTCRTI